MISIPTPPPLVKALASGAPHPQGAFLWKREGWLAQMHDRSDVADVLRSLPDRLDRNAVREVVLRELDSGRVLPAFVPAMVWGYGTMGAGPLRTRWMLTGVGTKGAGKQPLLAAVEENLAAGAHTVRAEGPLEAFRLMNNERKIKHLGPAYFTKWLYFASAVDVVADPDAAPIYDMRVRRWIRANAGVSLRNRTSGYAEYLRLLDSWREPHGVSRADVELHIFRLATGRG